MSDKELEAPEADAAEQEQDAIPEVDEDVELEEIPLEAPPEDTAEQARAVRLEDDDYR